MTTLLDRVAQTLGRVYAMSWPAEVARMLITPRGEGTGMSIPQAYELLAQFGVRLPAELVPLAVVDEGSIACTAVTAWGAVQPGEVLRLHLSDVNPDAQLRLLDIDPLAYVMSLSEELAARDEGLRRMLDEIGPAYQANYLRTEKRPRDFAEFGTRHPRFVRDRISFLKWLWQDRKMNRRSGLCNLR